MKRLAYLLPLALVFTVLGQNLFQLVDEDAGITYLMIRRPGIDITTVGTDGSCFVWSPDSGEQQCPGTR